MKGSRNSLSEWAAECFGPKPTEAVKRPEDDVVEILCSLLPRPVAIALRDAIAKAADSEG
jgi:hypothetical protein